LPGEFSLLLLAKPLAWLAVVLATTLLLRRRQVTTKIRLAFLIGGVLFFGFIFGQIATGKLDPSPLDSLRNLLQIITGQQQPTSLTARPTMALFALVMPGLLSVGFQTRLSAAGLANWAYCKTLSIAYLSPNGGLLSGCLILHGGLLLQGCCLGWWLRE